MDDNRHFDNSTGVSSSTMGKSLPDGKELQEMADIVCHAKLMRLSVPLVPSSCLDVGELRPEGEKLQKGAYYATKRRRDPQEIWISTAECRRNPDSLFNVSEYSENTEYFTTSP